MALAASGTDAFPGDQHGHLSAATRRRCASVASAARSARAEASASWARRSSTAAPLSSITVCNAATSPAWASRRTVKIASNVATYLAMSVGSGPLSLASSAVSARASSLALGRVSLVRRHENPRHAVVAFLVAPSLPADQFDRGLPIDAACHRDGTASPSAPVARSTSG